MVRVKRVYLLLACKLTAIPAAASFISDFSVTDENSQFTTSLQGTFDSGSAIITGMFFCDSTTTCSGEVGTFTLDATFTTSANSIFEQTLCISGTIGEGVGALATLAILSPPPIRAGNWAGRMFSRNLHI